MTSVYSTAVKYRTVETLKAKPTSQPLTVVNSVSSRCQTVASREGIKAAARTSVTAHKPGIPASSRYRKGIQNRPHMADPIATAQAPALSVFVYATCAEPFIRRVYSLRSTLTVLIGENYGFYENGPRLVRR